MLNRSVSLRDYDVPVGTRNLKAIRASAALVFRQS